MQPEQELELDLRQLWRALMRRKWIIIALFALAVVGAYFATNAMTPIYQATTTVLLTDSPQSLSLPILDGAANNTTKMQTTIEILKSRTMALETARRLGYDWTEYSPGLGAFRSRITVQPVSGADMIRISVQHEDSQDAARIANALVEAFEERSQLMNTMDVRAAREFIEEQLIQFEADLAAAEEALVRFQQTEQIVTPSGEMAAVLGSISRLEERRAEAMVARETAIKRLEALHAGEFAEENRSVTSSAVVQANPLIESIRSQLISLETQRAAALEQYTDRHPRVIALNAQIEQLQEQLNEQIGRIEVSGADTRLSQEIISIQASIVAYEATIAALGELIADREALLGGLPEKELRLTRLIRQLDVTEQIYTALLQRYQEMRITEAMEPANITMLDPAVVPRSPISPRRTLNMAIAGFLGLFVGVGLAFLLEYLDTSFKQPEELEAYLGLPVLGRAPIFSTAVKNKPY